MTSERFRDTTVTTLKLEHRVSLTYTPTGKFDYLVDNGLDL
jgi:hypothetical protein